MCGLMYPSEIQLGPSVLGGWPLTSLLGQGSDLTMDYVVSGYPDWTLWWFSSMQALKSMPQPWLFQESIGPRTALLMCPMEKRVLVHQAIKNQDIEREVKPWIFQGYSILVVFLLPPFLYWSICPIHHQWEKKEQWTDAGQVLTSV